MNLEQSFLSWLKKTFDPKSVDVDALRKAFYAGAQVDVDLDDSNLSIFLRRQAEGTDMKFLRSLVESQLMPNAYFIVNTDVEAWRLVDHTPSNHYYGSARLHKPNYERFFLYDTDEIHWLHGGLFFVTEEGVFSGQLTPPGDFSPFEKRYGDPNQGRRSQLSNLVDKGAIEQISSREANIPANYNTSR